MGSDARGARQPASRFPDDMALRLERYGRYESHRQNSGIEYSEIVDILLAPFAPHAARDPYGFCLDLMAVIAHDGGRLATLGAARLVWMLVLPQHRQLPPALALIRGGIAYKHAHGLPLTFDESRLR